MSKQTYVININMSVTIESDDYQSDTCKVMDRIDNIIDMRDQLIVDLLVNEAAVYDSNGKQIVKTCKS